MEVHIYSVNAESQAGNSVHAESQAGDIQVKDIMTTQNSKSGKKIS